MRYRLAVRDLHVLDARLQWDVPDLDRLVGRTRRAMARLARRMDTIAGMARNVGARDIAARAARVGALLRGQRTSGGGAVGVVTAAPAAPAASPAASPAAAPAAASAHQLPGVVVGSEQRPGA